MKSEPGQNPAYRFPPTRFFYRRAKLPLSDLSCQSFVLIDQDDGNSVAIQSGQSRVLCNVNRVKRKRTIDLDMPGDSERHMAQMAIGFGEDGDFHHRRPSLNVKCIT